MESARWEGATIGECLILTDATFPPNAFALQVFQHLSEGHRNVVTFEEFLLTPSYACLVMPYYDEPMTVCLPFAACRVYFHGMATAVQWLHTNHVTHNDIKLANTLVKRSGKDPIGQPVLVGEQLLVEVDELAHTEPMSLPYRLWLCTKPQPRHQLCQYGELGYSRISEPRTHCWRCS